MACLGRAVFPGGKGGVKATPLEVRVVSGRGIQIAVHQAVKSPDHRQTANGSVVDPDAFALIMPPRPPSVDPVEPGCVHFIGRDTETKPMPLYEYACEKCGRNIELLIRGDEQPECPHCLSTKLTKLLSVVSGHVAGGGVDPGAAGGCGRPQCGMGGCAGLE